MDGHNTLEDIDENDPVISSIRYGMESIMKMAHETLPRCPTNDENLKKSVTEKIENSFLQLIEAELAYTQTASIVNEVVDELNLQDYPDMDPKEFFDSVSSISDLANERIADYKRTLTQDVLRSHPTFLRMQGEIESSWTHGSGDGLDGTGNEDAETEAEEVELDGSVLEDGDNEVIPELDPISKQPLKDPVRNRVCRHIYGKAAMLQLIKQNPKTRCPAMGCDNKGFVKPSDLVNDPKLTARVNGTAEASSSAASTPTSKKQKKKSKGRRR